jgi:hypothetical protein
MWLGFPGCDKGDGTDQQSEAHETGQGNPPGSLSDETTKISAEYRVKTLSNQVRNKVIRTDDESRKHVFRNTDQDRVCGIACHNSENGASEISARHILLVGRLKQRNRLGQANIVLFVALYAWK